MVFVEPEFVYTKDIEDIAPLKLNLTFSKKENNHVTFELRKKITINLDDVDSKKFWISFFSSSLEGKTIKSNILIAFKDKFGSACKLKQLGLLKSNTKILTD